ncbi:threonine aldolase [Acidobacteria bacterium Mor1]|nr:threonine aldolase [Acidobacteria bacterium Mor1]
MSQPVDLRSDTVTRPTAAMRRAMAEAEVGDDVYGEDPTVRRLEEQAAEWTGQPAALFVPTGTMGNQCAIHLQASPGADVLVERESHVYLYELGAMAALSGATPRALDGERGRLTPGAVSAAVSPDLYYMAPTRLLVLENTHNHAGGVVVGAEHQNALIDEARRHRLAVHLDGARVFHAAAASGRPLPDFTSRVDTVMFCLSKGLGAPLGSMLCGSVELMREARVIRKRFGGGMRQAGIVAAAGLYALEHHVERLADDHRRARKLAEAVAELDPFELDPAAVETNILIADVRPGYDAGALLASLRESGLVAGPMGPGRIRFVTHLEIDDEALERAIATLRRVSRDAGPPVT